MRENGYENNEGKWVCAPHVDEEIWRSTEYFDTKEEAIAAVKAAAATFDPDPEGSRQWDLDDLLGATELEKLPTSFAVGQCLMHKLPKLAGAVIDRAQEQLYDEAGEVAEGYLDYVTKENLEELEQLIQDWFLRTDNIPRFYTLVNVEEVQL